MHATELTGKRAAGWGGEALARGLAGLGQAYLSGWSWYVRQGLTPPGSRDLPRQRSPAP